VLTRRKGRLARLEYGTGDDDWMFPSTKKKLRTPASLINAFKASLDAAGIKKRISPHKLRYCFNDCLRGRALTR
jgi:integrase